MDAAVTAAVLTGAATVLAAAGSLLVSHWSNRRQRAYEARLARRNEQLAALYGPMLALTRADDAVWSAFVVRHPLKGNLEPGANVSPAWRSNWERWMRVVFMPANRRVVALIESRSDLLEGDEMPPVLLDLCAHVAGWEVTLQQWEAGDYSDLLSIIDHPGPVLSRYVESTFQVLKADQRNLLQLTTVSGRRGFLPALHRRHRSSERSAAS